MSSIWDNPDTVETLRKLWMDGKSAREVAKAFGNQVTRSAVIGKVHRLGIQRGEPHQLKNKIALAARLKARAEPKTPKPKAEPKPPVSYSPRRALDLARAAKEPPAKILGIVPGSEPRPFLSRSFLSECAWIVAGDGAESLVCCLPIAKGSYCEAHSRASYTGAPTTKHLAPRRMFDRVRV